MARGLVGEASLVLDIIYMLIYLIAFSLRWRLAVVSLQEGRTVLSFDDFLQEVSACRSVLTNSVKVSGGVAVCAVRRGAGAV